jgi:[lysine-biosynthesis-protein LysW]--L-2-aminoadipate ligase
MIRVGFLYTRLRVEEKYLLEEFEKHSDVEIVRINDGDTFFDISQLPEPIDVLFERSISYSRGLYISRIFEAHRYPHREFIPCSGTMR